jgi:hypothetical protein
MNSTAALAHFAENPRATAREAGLTNAEANELVGQGRLIPVGNRVTGMRGRPPMEYVVAGTDVDTDLVQAQVEAARDRLGAHRTWERLSNAIMRAADAYGHGSPEHVEAKLIRTETFAILPPLPSKNDYVLAGEFVDAPETEEAVV